MSELAEPSDWDMLKAETMKEPDEETLMALDDAHRFLDGTTEYIFGEINRGILEDYFGWSSKVPDYYVDLVLGYIRKIQDREPA